MSTQHPQVTPSTKEPTQETTDDDYSEFEITQSSFGLLRGVGKPETNIVHLQGLIGNKAVQRLLNRGSIRVHTANRNLIQRDPSYSLPHTTPFTQGEAPICGMASLVAALILWDEDAHDLNFSRTRRAFNNALAYVASHRAQIIRDSFVPIVQAFEPTPNRQVEWQRAERRYNDNVRLLRNAQGQIDINIAGREFAEGMTRLFRVGSVSGGSSANESGNAIMAIGMTPPDSQDNRPFTDNVGSFDGIFHNQVVSSLRVGEAAHISWLTRQQVAHAFVILRRPVGYTIYDQGIGWTATAPDLNTLMTQTIAAAQSGASWIWVPTSLSTPPPVSLMAQRITAPSLPSNVQSTQDRSRGGFVQWVRNLTGL